MLQLTRARNRLTTPATMTLPELATSGLMVTTKRSRSKRYHVTLHHQECLVCASLSDPLENVLSSDAGGCHGEFLHQPQQVVSCRVPAPYAAAQHNQGKTLTAQCFHLARWDLLLSKISGNLLLCSDLKSRSSLVTPKCLF